MRYVKHVMWDNSEVMSRFRALWDEGVSTRLIGERLGCSKNAVVGKAHREHFPARPSPIALRTGKPIGAKNIRRECEKLLPQLNATVTKPVAPIHASRTRIEPCAYPINQAGFPKFKLCEIPSMPGKPYCAAHCLICFIATNRPEGKRIRAEWTAYVERTDARAQAGVMP